ncbi:MAG: hypothetical protein ACI4GO_08355, partial [Hominenteromicrobium sp.]
MHHTVQNFYHCNTKAKKMQDLFENPAFFLILHYCAAYPAAFPFILPGSALKSEFRRSGCTRERKHIADV